MAHPLQDPDKEDRKNESLEKLRQLGDILAGCARRGVVIDVLQTVRRINNEVTILIKNV